MGDAEQVVVGRGRLTWDAGERRSDRYGYVYLINSGDSKSAGPADYAALNVQEKHIGLGVRLLAVVTETRRSTHIGDLYHCIFPTTPDVGETVVLGTGTLTVGRNCEGAPAIGVKPSDERQVMWLDIYALYRCHEQTVELRYEILPACSPLRVKTRQAPRVVQKGRE